MYDTMESSYTDFRKKLRENEKYNILRSMVGEMMGDRGAVTDPGPEDLAPLASADLNSSILRAETVKLLKDKVENRMTKHSTDETSKKVTTLKLISKKQADWETNFKGAKTMSYQLTMSEDENSGKEYFVFSPTSSAVSGLEPNTEIEVRFSGDQNSCDLDINLLNLSEPARLISNLSDLEQYFLLLGSMDEDKNLHLVVESDVLTKLFEQFEVKHGFKITLISKLEQKSPRVYCSVETEAAWNSIPVRTQVKQPGAESFELTPVKTNEDDSYPPNCPAKEESEANLPSRKHQNPDEIIEGRPKWTEMRFVRKRRLDGEDVEHEDCFDFDRLNPHRTFVQEFEDSLDNTDWAYNHTVLKMMADLNSETLVTLGDSRLKPDLEEKMLKEYEEWEKYKRDNKHNYPQVKLKRLKSDKLVKSYKITKIVTKSLRKSPIHCSTPFYS